MITNREYKKIYRPISIIIHFDSLNEAFGFPDGYRDPSFFEVFDRFMEFSQTFNFKYSIFLIGRDLKNPEIFSRVREWSQNGHEICNHGWSHRTDLGWMDIEKTRKQVELSHEYITKCTGREPKGFVAPAWTTSKNLISILIKNNYLYDLSSFPSFMLYPMVASIMVGHLNNPLRLKRIIKRKDWLVHLKNPHLPYIVNSSFKRCQTWKTKNLIVFPMPVINKMSIPYWHTIGFMLGWEFAFYKLKELINKHPYFYYLLHPADLLDINDVTGDYTYSLKRISIPISQKNKALNMAFQIISESRRPIVTMREMANNIVKINEENA